MRSRTNVLMAIRVLLFNNELFVFLFAVVLANVDYRGGHLLKLLIRCGGSMSTVLVRRVCSFILTSCGEKYFTLLFGDTV